MKRRECLTILGALAVGSAAMGRVLPLYSATVSMLTPPKSIFNTDALSGCTIQIQRPANRLADNLERAARAASRIEVG